MSGVSFTWHGPKVEAAATSAARKGLRKAAEHLLAESVKQAPVREGTLRGSGQVTPIGDDTMVVHFNTVYAVRQHEEVGWRHPKGGKAKYLEDPFYSEQDTMRGIIAAETKGALG